MVDGAVREAAEDAEPALEGAVAVLLRGALVVEELDFDAEAATACEVVAVDALVGGAMRAFTAADRAEAVEAAVDVDRAVVDEVERLDDADEDETAAFLAVVREELVDSVAGLEVAAVVLRVAVTTLRVLVTVLAEVDVPVSAALPTAGAAATLAGMMMVDAEDEERCRDSR